MLSCYLVELNIVEVLENQKAEYNRFVIENESGSFLQSWEWGQWQAALGRTVYRYWLLDDSQKRIGVMQLIKMPLPFGQYYLYAPYGPVVDLRFKIEDLRFFTQEIKKQFSDAVFIRIEPKNHIITKSYNHEIIKSINVQPGKTLVIDLSKPEEHLLAEMHPKTRYNIKLAQKRGVEVQKDLVVTPGFGLYFKEVVGQIAQTENRRGFVGHGIGYYQKFIDFFALKPQSEIQVSVYKALYQKRLLCGAIMVDFGGTRTYLFGGSGEENKNVMAPYLLHWQAMTDAKAKGFKFYDFWGLETSSGKVPGFARFKLGFGGEEKIFVGAFDVIIRPVYYKLYQAARFCRRLFRGWPPA